MKKIITAGLAAFALLGGAAEAQAIDSWSAAARVENRVESWLDIVGVSAVCKRRSYGFRCSWWFNSSYDQYKGSAYTTRRGRVYGIRITSY